MSIRIDLDTMRANHDLPPLTNEQWARHFAKTHLRVAENVTLCQRAEGKFPWGEWLSDDPAEVGCQTCLEWMHA